MKFRAIPQIPRSADPAVQAVLEALKENFELMAGQRGAGTFIADELGYTPANKAGDTLQGLLLTPTRPAFHALYSGAGGAATGGTDIIYNLEQFDVAGNYDPTNGRFTAPVYGLYFFAWHGLYANAATGDLRTALYKNGTGLYGMRFIDDKSYANWTTFKGSGVVLLNAGDYVTVRCEQHPGAIHVDPGYTGFSGFLIG